MCVTLFRVAFARRSLASRYILMYALWTKNILFEYLTIGPIWEASFRRQLERFWRDSGRFWLPFKGRSTVIKRGARGFVMSDANTDDRGNQPDGSTPAEPRSHESFILRLLIQTYGQDWCPPDSSDNQKAKTLAVMSLVSRATIAGILSGKTKGRRRVEKLLALSDVFRGFDGNLPANCFRRSAIENVKSVCAAYTASNPPQLAESIPGRQNIEARGPRDVISFKIPGYAQSAEAVKLNLPGTYVTYRYAFERGDVGDGKLVAREVLHVEKDGADLAFRLSFCRNMGDHDSDPQLFGGKVIPFASSLLFVGFDLSDKIPSRGRTLFIPRISFGPLRNCNIGVLSGTRMHLDYGPAVACILIFRAPTQDKKHVSQFIKNVTRNEPVAKVLNRDFGRNKEHHFWIRAFLDNCPAGTENEPERAKLQKIHGSTKRPIDGALRINLTRFEQYMPTVFNELNNSSEANAPFKENWRPEGGPVAAAGEQDQI
jgi:hypothetical protein